MTKVSPATKSMRFVKDEDGEEVLMQADTFQVMMPWEKPFMEEAVDELKPKGDVLELGFGFGFAADQIETFHPKSHTIIECEEAVISRAKKWAKRHKGVHLIEGPWQEAMAKLSIFDSIFFDAFAPLDVYTIGRMEQNAAYSTQVAERTRELRDSLQEALSQFRNVHFSDEEVRDFGKQMLERNDINPAEVSDFIDSLQKQGNITTKQKTFFIREFAQQLKNKAKNPVPSSLDQLMIEPPKLPEDPFFVFADLCLSQHMRQGSRLCSYLRSPKTVNGLKEFRKRMKARKDINYSEKEIETSAPDHSQNYQNGTALCIVIEKK